VALRGKIVDFVGLNLSDDANQIGGIDHVTIVQDEFWRGLMRILVEVVDPFGVERGSPALQAVNLIPFRQKKFRQVRSVLSGNPGDQRTLWQTSTSWILAVICMSDSGHCISPVECGVSRARKRP
jgi:hypothetical protein